MKKICMVTTSRLDIDSRIQNEAEALSRDFEVTVLMREYSEPITLKNTPYTVKRIPYRHYSLFLLNIFSSMLALRQAAFRENPDFYHAHDIDGLFITAPVARKKKIPLIYDSHELWSENLANSQLKSVKWIIPILEKRLIGSMIAGITASQGYAEQLDKKYHRSFTVIRNMPKLEEMAPSELNFHEMFPGKTVLLHVGQTGAARGADKIILAMKDLPASYVLVFLGGKKHDAFKKMIDELDLSEKIIFVDAIPPKELVNAIKTADVGIVMTEGLSLSKYYSLPNKLLQYIAGELPVLASDIPEHRRIIEKENIGRLVSNEPEEIAKVILEMTSPEQLSVYRKNLQGLAGKCYNWEEESKRLVDFYKNLE